MNTQRSILITGCSTGIGLELARELGRDGFHVIATARNPAGLREKIDLPGDHLDILSLDVTAEASRREAAAKLEEILDRRARPGLDGLINNAGIVVAGPLEILPLDRLREQMETNVIGLLGVTQLLLPLMHRAVAASGAGAGRKERFPARIINVGSISGRVAAPVLGPYAMSKYALEAMSDALRLELHGSGIAVSLLEPGPVATPIWTKSLSLRDGSLDGQPHDVRERYHGMLEKVGREVEKSANAADPPALVTRAVRHALNVRRPRARYPIGRGTRATIMLLSLLPDRLRDAAMLKRLT